MLLQSFRSRSGTPSQSHILMHKMFKKSIFGSISKMTHTAIFRSSCVQQRALCKDSALPQFYETRCVIWYHLSIKTAFIIFFLLVIAEKRGYYCSCNRSFSNSLLSLFCDTTAIYEIFIIMGKFAV